MPYTRDDEHPRLTGTGDHARSRNDKGAALFSDDDVTAAQSAVDERIGFAKPEARTADG